MLVKKKERKYLYNNNFARLLQNMGIYHRVLELIKENKHSSDVLIKLAFSKDIYHSELVSLFTWNSTDEGQIYWQRINNIISEKLKKEGEYEERKRGADHIGGEIT